VPLCCRLIWQTLHVKRRTFDIDAFTLNTQTRLQLQYCTCYNAQTMLNYERATFSTITLVFLERLLLFVPAETSVVEMGFKNWVFFTQKPKNTSSSNFRVLN